MKIESLPSVPGKSSSAYTIGVGALMLVSILVANVDALAVSQYLTIPWRKELCAALFLFGAVTGAWALLRITARAAQPWRVLQAQVTLPYLMFFVATLLAIAISR